MLKRGGVVGDLVGEDELGGRSGERGALQEGRREEMKDVKREVAVCFGAEASILKSRIEE